MVFISRSKFLAGGGGGYTVLFVGFFKCMNGVGMAFLSRFFALYFVLDISDSYSKHILYMLLL